MEEAQEGQTSRRLRSAFALLILLSSSSETHTLFINYNINYFNNSQKGEPEEEK